MVPKGYVWYFTDLAYKTINVHQWSTKTFNDSNRAVNSNTYIACSYMYMRMCILHRVRFVQPQVPVPPYKQ